MSNDNFWLGVMLCNFFGNKQKNNGQNRGGCLSSLIAWFFILAAISIIGSLSRVVGLTFIKIKNNFIIHPVISWVIVLVLLLLIIFGVRKIIKNKKSKSMQNELESIPKEEKTDSIENN